jgi:hypothetical protein
VVTQDRSIGFWEYGDRRWTWWEKELPFLSITPPVNGWALAKIPTDKADTEVALLHFTGEGPQWQGTARIPEDPMVGWLGAPPREAIVEGDLQGLLYVVTGEAIYVYDAPDLDLPRERRPINQVERRPPGHFRIDHRYAPHVVGTKLFVHFQGRTSVRLDVEEGVAKSLEVAPITKCKVLWAALENERTEVVARAVAMAQLLPATPLLGNAKGEPRLLDAHVEADGTLRDVLTTSGVLPESEAPESPGDKMLTGSSGIWQNGIRKEGQSPSSGTRSCAPETWALWLGRRSAETKMYHALCTSADNGLPELGVPAESELVVESLLEGVGTIACERLLQTLEEVGLPKSNGYPDNYDGAGLRRLATACGPTAAPAVAEALTSDSVQVRTAACWAAGALDGVPAGSGLGNLDAQDNAQDISGSALWPKRSDIPRDALTENLTREDAVLQRAAVGACARLDLSGVAKHLRPLLRKTPLLQRSNSKLRKAVLKAFQALSDVPEAARSDIEHCARRAPSEEVRAAAVKALGTVFEDPPHESLSRAVGDAPAVSRAAGPSLLRHAGSLSPALYRQVIDRWLLQSVGSRQDNGGHGPANSTFPHSTLLEDILLHRLLEENQIETGDISSPRELNPKDLSASRTWFEMASWGLSARHCWTLLFSDEEPPRNAAEKRDGSALETTTAVFEQAKEIAFADEDVNAAASLPAAGEEEMPERAFAIHNRDPGLGRRLAAISYYALGPSNLSGEEKITSKHQPLHKRLRSVSTGPPPRKRLEDIVWELAQGEKAGGALGLYVLAICEDDRAEALLIDRLADDNFDSAPLIWTLLNDTEPFCSRPDEFLGAAVGPYLGDSSVLLARRWMAFQKTFSWRGLDSGELPAGPSAWRNFLVDCTEAPWLLPWKDRHRAALHLAHCTRHADPLKALWEAKTTASGEVPEDRTHEHARDMIWAGYGSEKFWTVFWKGWPENADVWALRMLGMRGSPGDIKHIQAAAQQKSSLKFEAERAIKHIEERSASR